MWRKKSMPHAEWSTLQNHFGDLMIALGGPENLAMFVSNRAGDLIDTVYITGPGIQTIEARSPGGWEDSPAPAGNVALLVGSGDPWATLGVPRPVR